MEDNKTAVLVSVVIFLIIFAVILIYIINSTNSSEKALNENYLQETNEDKSNYDNTYDSMNVDKKSLVKEDIETKISSYSTSIYDNDKNRMFNLDLACSKLNGYVIKSGAEFSFNKALGKMDESAGYKKATGFDSNGNNIKVYAGGMCQLSSTTYNTALIAKLKITERHAHSKRVSYVPKGKDATIYYGSLDLKFINNTKNDIRIKSNTDGSKVTVAMYKISSGQ